MNKVRKFIIILVFGCSFIEKTNCIENTDFSSPDITRLVNDSDEQTQLEAFKLTSNDSRNEYGKLIWVSIGNPRILKTPSIQNKTVLKIFHFSNDGFYTYIQMLTEKHQKLLVKSIKQKYDIDVGSDQIVNLIPTSFNCFINLFSNSSQIAFKGNVTDFRNFPLILKFQLNSNEKLLFQKLLDEKSEELIDLECEILNVKDIKEKVLTLSAEKISDLKLIERIFGPLNIVYATREQLKNLATEVYSRLDIEEEYELSLDKFIELFINQLVGLNGNFRLDQISFDKAENSLSNYSRNYDEFKGDEIYRDLRELFEVRKINEKDYIHVNDDVFELLKNQFKLIESTSDLNGLLYLELIRIDGCIRNVKSKLNYWKTSVKLLDEQLNDLNTDKGCDVQWKIDGDRIIQKSLNVVKLNRNLFETLKFNKIRKQISTIQFQRKFNLHIPHYFYENSMTQCLTQSLKPILDDNKNSTNQVNEILNNFNSLNDTINSVIDRFQNISSVIFNINDLISSLNKQRRESGNYVLRKTLVNNLWVSLLVSLPNNELASATGDYTIKIWDLNNGQVKKILKGHSDSINSLIILPNGDLASGSSDKSIKIWNINDGTLKKTLDGHTDRVRSLVTLPNGDLVSGSDDNTIKIWNINDGTIKKTLDNSIDGVFSLGVLPNGYLASASFKGIKIWDTNDGTLKKILTDYTSSVNSFIVLPDGNFASQSYKDVKIWDIQNGKVKSILAFDYTGKIQSVIILPNGDLAIGSVDGTINIWNINNGTIKKTIFGHAASVQSLVVLSNGDIVSGSYDKTIKIWT